jgi:hypothetical protein
MNVKVLQLTNVLGEGGQPMMKGKRGPFAMLQGSIGEDVLQWLREEVAQDNLALTFKPKGKAKQAKDRAVENKIKIEVAGHLKGHCLDLHLCCRGDVLESCGPGWSLGYGTYRGGRVLG